MRSTAKKLLLASYYAASQPFRFALHRQLRRLRELPAAVLFYHRVADINPTPWTISNRDFRRHIQYLKEHFELVSLATLQSQHHQQSSSKMMVAITFDDGYAENFDQAIPMLLEERIPFTYFVSSNYVLSQLPFPHDVKLGLSLAPNTPEQIRFLADQGVVIGGHTRSHADMGQVAQLEQIRHEILGDIRVLEAITGKAIDYFAFPYGDLHNMSQSAIDVLREAGIRGMCSAYGEFNRPSADPWHIKRIHGDPGMLRLKNWLTLDPRKFRRQKKFPFDFLPLGQVVPNAQLLEVAESFERPKFEADTVVAANLLVSSNLGSAAFAK